jgi:CheY-like chemotaxis protein
MAGADQRPLRVLALEDDTDTADVLALVLAPEDGYALDLCDSAQGCVDLLRSRKNAPYDVMVLDLLLSQGHNGMEVLAAARADPELRPPPIVICTAISPARLETFRPAFEGFETRVVFKPFDLDTLQAAIHEAAGFTPIAPLDPSMP